MLVSDNEVSDLKAWIVNKLEDISDADSDVLADYVLALIRTEAPDEQLKANAIENLEDFLRDYTTNFVNEVFQVIYEKSFLPGYAPPTTSNTSPILPIPTAPAASFDPSPIRNGTFQITPQSRKRSYNDANETRQGYDAHYGSGDRNLKQTRRGGSAGLGNRGNFNSTQPPSFSAYAPTGQGQLPGSQTNVGFNPNDTMAAMMAMQAMGIPLPPVPGTETQRSHGPPHSSGKNRINARCRDYDMKGICLRGVACPFNHGNNSVVVPSHSEEYDPKTPTLVDFPSTVNGHGTIADSRGRGVRARVRGFSDRGGHPNQRRNRAEFSMPGANHDRSIRTVVVEQIPEENFDETQVIDFFSGFGAIEEVTMKPYKRLALVKFDNYFSAKAAYDSPKVIFDNRFVKVYWFKPDAATASSPTDGTSQPKVSSPSASSPIKSEETAFDIGKFQRDSEAAQKKLEDRKVLQEQTVAKLAELEKQQAELAKKREEEIQRMKEKLEAKGHSLPSTMAVDKVKEDEDLTAEGDKPKRSANTEKLLAQLKALEDEARSLGLDPSSSPGRGRGGPPVGRGRGRGSYRGFSYDPSYQSYRGGGFRAGRGGPAPFRGAVRAGRAYNLDNRPKKVKVSGVEFDEQREEGLRQFLFTVGEFTSADPSPSSEEAKDGMTIAFKDRFTAEKFFFGPKDIPGVGKLEFSWIANDPVSTRGGAVAGGALLKDEDTQMGGTPEQGEVSRGVGAPENEGGAEREREDYDVAEEEEWIA